MSVNIVFPAEVRVIDSPLNTFPSDLQSFEETPALFGVKKGGGRFRSLEGSCAPALI